MVDKLADKCNKNIDEAKLAGIALFEPANECACSYTVCIVLVVKATHFSFDGDLYDQIDGVAMGSPLAPALANLFMSHYETKWLQNEKASDVLHYKRYVDDIFCLFKTEIEVEKFYSFINCQHPNIKFTLEKEHNKTLPFLDILVKSNENKIETSVYYKKTYTGLLTYYFSFTPTVYKSS